MVSISVDASNNPIPMIGNAININPNPFTSRMLINDISINAITTIVMMNRIRHADPVKNANAFMSSSPHTQSIE